MIKAIARVLITSFLFFFVGLIVTFSVTKQRATPGPYQIKRALSDSSNVSKKYTVSEKKSLKKSVDSAVRVMSVDESGEGISLASGTYFVYLGKYYVLTVSHAVAGLCKD